MNLNSLDEPDVGSGILVNTYALCVYITNERVLYPVHLLMMRRCQLKQNVTINFIKRLTTQVAALDKTTNNHPKSNQFQSINISSISNALKISGVNGLSHKGKQLHSPVIKLGYHKVLSLLNQLLSLYVKCSKFDDACKLFDEMLLRNVVTWNTLISDSRTGLCYFRRMMMEKVNPDCVTCFNLVTMSIQVGQIKLCKQFHCCIVKWGFCKDCYVNSCLVDMYAKLGFVVEARSVFDDVLEKDLVLWNVMVSCYALNRLRDDSFKVFWMMQLEGVKGDEFTYTSLVNCCVCLADHDLGKQVHGHVLRFGFDRDVVVASALVDMYAKNESIADARKVFDDMSPRNLISWNTMIVGYGQCSDGMEATKLLTEMLHDDIDPDELTLASVVSSCGDLSLKSQILQVHSYAFKTGILSYLSVSNSFVNAYSKSGNIVSALKSFYLIKEPDLVSYTTMVQAYAFHGLSRKAIDLFEKMEPGCSWLEVVETTTDD
ncbi:hypothetical protein E3N88_43889 [Mikania micrantha]|uniref:Pentatricopeptide repeat-containing protein n=1 Tax=Mikania micrantha TaxID=192012 RepID=A0A5N6LDM2_9ASTR|nr:hypothetical protein E3N88_43889 [Mikania micrantha]